MQLFPMATFNEKFPENLFKLFTFWIPSRKIRRKLREKYCRKEIPEYYGNKKIYKGEESQEIIKEELNSNKPSLITRFGTNEYFVIWEYLRRLGYEKSLKKSMTTGAGFFPSTNKNFDRFAIEALQISRNIDILGVWNLRDEDKYICKYLPKKAKLTLLKNLNSIQYENPWSECLKNKKVLVIHPFADSIKKQYQKRELLFKNSKILPNFKLITLKAIQTQANSSTESKFNDWFEALDFMKNEIKNIDFDIAIIGAGAYGMFLADYCKTLEKKAIHIGGDTQLLFGIIGSRWNFSNEIFKYSNTENFIYPSFTERPIDYKKCENGCYW